MAEGLTARQRSVLEFVKDYISENGYPPSLREICSRFGINSPKNARKHLEALEKKGFIKRASNTSRAIDVLGAPDRDAVSVPIAGRVRAGSPHLAVEDIMGRVVLDARFFRCRDAFLLRVEGESMTYAGIDEGDLVMVSPGTEVADNDIVVALLDDDATVKRFFRIGGTVILRPENPAFSPITVREGERELHIVGKVISVIKRIG